MNLSEQICELCGIEPRYFIETDIGVFHQDNREKAERIAMKYNSVVLDVYPDFRNKNFINLFNLLGCGSNIMTVMDFVLCDINCVLNIHTTDDFLSCLIDRLKDKNYLPVETENIKQAIREAEWEY